MCGLADVDDFSDEVVAGVHATALLDDDIVDVDVATL